MFLWFSHVECISFLIKHLQSNFKVFKSSMVLGLLARCLLCCCCMSVLPALITGVVWHQCVQSADNGNPSEQQLHSWVQKLHSEPFNLSIFVVRWCGADFKSICTYSCSCLIMQFNTVKGKAVHVSAVQAGFRRLLTTTELVKYIHNLKLHYSAFEYGRQNYGVYTFCS